MAGLAVGEGRVVVERDGKASAMQHETKAGIDLFVDLTKPQETAAYDTYLPAGIEGKDCRKMPSSPRSGCRCHTASMPGSWITYRCIR